jgi:hypothetical protein
MNINRKGRLDAMPAINHLQFLGGVHLDGSEPAGSSGLSGNCCVSRPVSANPGVHLDLITHLAAQ